MDTGTDASQAALQIDPISAFSDNYIWLLHRGGPGCAVVDPGDAAPVLTALSERGLELATILITHHHWDHAGGVPELLERWPGAKVYGPADRRLGEWNQAVGAGDSVPVETLGLTFEVMEVPAHTRSHIAFLGHGCLFSGDTLFSIGCGRLFEGTAEDMQAAMDQFATLPGTTKVYCGHEYTRDNCRFALAVEPDNRALQQRAETVRALRERGKPSLPSVLEEEFAANPFLRTREPAVVAAAKAQDASAEPGARTMAAIRAWKDRF